ncbi:MAG: 5-oxoprolinase subunit PxpB [Armatimonadota bacterium]|nr:5-oxoprolinase subunit PxpB [Armatimonadota bacterium]MDR5676118.1 5-oxoprolinase subunit PxpB [Armatimonadota bacterium]MDR5688545.1 5-oxoprolinase subunit PxpB [Armatimonadota bacterium]MDR7386133.1 5-oxoprolinase subunit PxpB [Armatimonadota bacterium]MDR7389016.1 5-oxoprolinase subunit PxpB [Armatimonadota bacterium]
MDVLPFGSRALLVRLGTAVDPRLLAQVLHVDRWLRKVPGVVETVPAYASLLVHFDPQTVDAEALAERARQAPDSPEAPLEGRPHEVPVVYGGEFGPDLAEVARWAGLSEREVVELHTGTEYLVYMLGFSPGFPYMGTVPQRIAVPRLPQPRPRVPSGSVAVAGRQTGIYPSPSPGGWRILGRTPLQVFDPARRPPALFEVGDRVRFVAVEEADWQAAPPVREREPDGVPAFVVLDGGLLCSVQDLGRFGYRRFGVPVSGAMDPEALRQANAAVGNAPECAGLEFTWPGPALEALVDVEVALAGADFGAEVDRSPVPLGEAVRVRRGQVLRFRTPRWGSWCYLAVAGGVQAPEVLGSRSTHVPSGLGGKVLRRGDLVRRARRIPGVTKPAAPRGSGPLRVVAGPHLAAFEPGALDRFLADEYVVTARSDRSGYRLEGPRVAHAGAGEILSEGMVVGAVQVPPSGQPIVLMPDGPTTGGYPVLAVVVEEDLPRLAQKRPGERVRFQLA